MSAIPGSAPCGHTIARPGYIETGGTRIYYEVRGDGPALVFVPGGGVDASHFAALASLLAGDRTTVTYDRRGYFRSGGRGPSTIARQADDLAAIIEGLDLAPAIVWGGSLGAFIVLDLLVRRPALVRAALVHEPPLFAVLPDGPGGESAPAPPGDVADPRTAMEAHARQALGDDFERLDAHHRERLVANGEAFFGTDLPGMAVSPAALASGLAGSTVPLYVLATPGDPEPALRRAARWVAEQAGTVLLDLPGGHMPYAIDPETTARHLTAILRHPPARTSPG